MQKITPHLWFYRQAKDAAKLYTSVFENSRITNTTVLHDTPDGDVDVLDIELAGQQLTLLNAGPQFQFTPAVSFLVALRDEGRSRCEVEVALRRRRCADGARRVSLQRALWLDAGPLRSVVAVDVHGRLPNRSEDHAVADVRRRRCRQGRRSDAVLHIDLRVLVDRQHSSLRPRRRARLRGNGETRLVHARRTGIRGDGQRARTQLHLQRGDLADRALRDAGRDRSLLGEAQRSAGIRSMRLAERSLRFVLANRSAHDGRAAPQQRRGATRASRRHFCR